MHRGRRIDPCTGLKLPTPGQRAPRRLRRRGSVPPASRALRQAVSIGLQILQAE
jgi:hypothetical protein